LESSDYGINIVGFGLESKYYFDLDSQALRSPTRTAGLDIHSPPAIE